MIALPAARPRPAAICGRTCATWFLALLALTGLADAAGAQDHTDSPSGWILDRPAPAAADPFVNCSTEPALPNGGAETGCTVSEAIELTTPVEAWLLRLRRNAEVPEGDIIAAVEIDELAIIEASGSGYRVVWRLPVDLRFERLSPGEVAAIGDATIVSFWLCVQGTGGCAQQFLIRDAGGWAVLQQPYLDALAARVPEGWAIHKGRQIELRGLTGAQPLLGPHDSNADPSGVIRFSVALVGRALQLVDSKVEVPEPAAESEVPPDSLDAGGASP